MSFRVASPAVLRMFVLPWTALTVAADDSTASSMARQALARWRQSHLKMDESAPGERRFA